MSSLFDQFLSSKIPERKAAMEFGGKKRSERGDLLHHFSEKRVRRENKQSAGHLNGRFSGNEER
jgi:hypothetical protein